MKRTFVTAVVRYNLHTWLPDMESEMTFSEYVKTNETPLEATKRRANELMDLHERKGVIRIDKIRVTEIEENELTGNQSDIRSYYI